MVQLTPAPWCMRALPRGFGYQFPLCLCSSPCLQTTVSQRSCQHGAVLGFVELHCDVPVFPRDDGAESRVHEVLMQSSWVRRARRVATAGDQVDGIEFLGPCAQAHCRGGHVHRDMAPVIMCRTFGGMDRHVINTHRQNQNHHSHLTQAFPLFCVTYFVSMASGQPVSAAQRRKQRRLRSWWRHEQQSIAAALATAHHHAVSSLRGADGVDDTAVKYLLRAEHKKKE